MILIMRPRPVAPPLARRAVRDADGRVVLAPLSAVGQRAVRLLDALEGLLGHGLLVLVGVQLERKLVERLLDLGGASGGRDACGAMDGWAAAWRRGRGVRSEPRRGRRRRPARLGVNTPSTQCAGPGSRS